MPLTPDQFDRAQPKFTPSHHPVPGQKTEGMMIDEEGIQPTGLSGQRVVGTIKDPENPGHRVQISVPHLPYERWIDDAGNVLSAVTRTTRVMKKNGKGSADDGSYKSKMELVRLQAGWVRYDDGLGRPSNLLDWTPAVRDALIAERRREQYDVMRYEEKVWLDKKKAESESVQRAMTDALTSFAEGQKSRQTRANKLAEIDK